MVQFNQLYGFVRGRQLDGTFPGDRSTGVWPITAYRVLHGWGSPPESAWPYENSLGAWPPPEPEGLDDLASAGRIGGYRRIRTLELCVSTLNAGTPVQVSLDITTAWADPPGGMIRHSATENIWLGAHSVVLESFDPVTQQFRFWNNWGPDWGDAGYGYINREAFADAWHEAWTFYPLPITHPKTFPDHILNTWTSQLPTGERWHWLQQMGFDGAVIGWTSMIETDESCELEELFVRPHFRSRGFGRKLLNAMVVLAANRKKLFLAWIPYADAGEDHLQLLELMFDNSGLTIHQAEERWAPYVAAPRVRADLQTDRSTTELPAPAWSLAFVKAIAEVVAASAGAKAVASEALRAWVDIRNGKRTRIKVGDVDVESTQSDEESLLRLLSKAIAAEDQKRRADSERKG